MESRGLVGKQSVHIQLIARTYIDSAIGNGWGGELYSRTGGIAAISCLRAVIKLGSDIFCFGGTQDGGSFLAPCVNL